MTASISQRFKHKSSNVSSLYTTDLKMKNARPLNDSSASSSSTTTSSKQHLTPEGARELLKLQAEQAARRQQPAQIAQGRLEVLGGRVHPAMPDYNKAVDKL